MRIAIHYSNYSFSERWVSYCKQQGIEFKLVNCYSNDIISQLDDCKALMWHHSQTNPKAVLSAKQILFALEHSGKKVFPDFKTAWHFDDKLGQKYLLEAIGAPLVPTYIFYDKQEALAWSRQTRFPKVFKLRSGAGSSNVRLVKTRAQAKRVIRKAFMGGFRNYSPWLNYKELLRKFHLGKATYRDLIRGFLHLLFPPKYSRVKGKEQGYVYFQDFIDGNEYDIRVVVIDRNAFAIKRLVRQGDFRASGSGNILYDKDLFDEKTIKLAFDLTERLNGQCIAFDFVYDKGIPKLLEISYGFVPEGYDPCPGYWNSSMKWIEGNFNPYGWMVEAVLKATNE